MAVISVCSTKGGVGKTTLVICLADAYARQGGSVAIIDADPNGHVASWRERAGDDCAVDVIADVTEKTVLDRISDAASRYSLVFVDLEGAASQGGHLRDRGERPGADPFEGVRHGSAGGLPHL